MKTSIRFMLLVLALCASAGCYTKKVAPKPFSSPQGRFVVMTPAPMAHKSAFTHWEAGDVTLHSYAVEHDGVIYAVNYFDVPLDVNYALRKEMQGSSAFPGREAMVKQHQWTIKDLKPAQTWRGPDKVTEGFAESFTATSANGKQVVSVRLVWFEDRMYQIMVAHPVVPSYSQMTNAQEFYSSFKLQ